MIFPSFDERLNLARERIGAATTPAERAARTTGQPPGAILQIAGRDFTPAPGMQQGYIGADGSGPTQDQQNTALERMMSTPAVDPAQATARMAPPPDGMMANPGATNFGRLATARTDVPAYVPRPMAPPAAGGTMLPTGNISAKNAMLRSAFPNATRAELGSMGEMAYNRPGAFNAAVAGTRLDPAQATERSQQAQASLAQTRASTAATLASPVLDPYQRALSVRGQELNVDRDSQALRITADDAARRTNNDAATREVAGDEADPILRRLAAAGADSATLIQFAQLAEQRARDRRSAEAAVPKEASFFGRQALVANGNVQFAEPADKGMYPDGPKIIPGPDGKPQFYQSGPNQAWQRYSDPTNMADVMGAALAGRAGAPAAAPQAPRAPAAAPAPKPTAAAKPAAPLSTPSQAHIAHLRQNPTLAAQFDAKFGPGAAKRALGQ